jgi:hypothetical protein
MRPKLQYLSSGSTVVVLQQRLNDLMPESQPGLQADGKFGNKTLSRVKEFQNSRGLVADGIVGKKTWAAIDSSAPALPGALPESSTTGSQRSATQDAAIKALGIRNNGLLRCTAGSGVNILMVGASKGYATVYDCIPNVNIRSFGLCKSESHPAYYGIENLSKSDKKKAMITNPVVCTPMPQSQWLTHGKLKDPVTGQQLITHGARCMCEYGGMIKVL